jgi:hypothetical protein
MQQSRATRKTSVITAAMGLLGSWRAQGRKFSPHSIQHGSEMQLASYTVATGIFLQGSGYDDKIILKNIKKEHL